MRDVCSTTSTCRTNCESWSPTSVGSPPAHSESGPKAPSATSACAGTRRAARPPQSRSMRRSTSRRRRNRTDCDGSRSSRCSEPVPPSPIASSSTAGIDQPARQRDHTGYLRVVRPPTEADAARAEEHDGHSAAGRQGGRHIVLICHQEAEMTETQVPTITLNDGREIPQLGFGVFQIPPEDTRQATATALQIGYRHIDTAEMYGNEREVGEAIADAGLARDESWVNSKLNNGYPPPDDARRAFEDSLTKLGLDQIDLFLIHWPLPTRYDGDYVSTWKALEGFHADGRARSIGVSNFQVPHLQRLAAECDVAPAVNQIELHPYLLNEEVRHYGEEHGIATEAWSPIAQGGVLKDPVITAIAERLERSPAQVVLRWHIQRDLIVFPKSVTESRVRENFALFDFVLDDRDVAAISGLDQGES